MKIISTLQLAGALLVCGASVLSTPAASDDGVNPTVPYNPNDPIRVPEVVVTASNPGNGCIVNYCYNGAPSGTQPFTPTSTSTGTPNWVLPPSKPIPAGANTRTTPECLREQIAQGGFMAALAAGKVPGRQIMAGSSMGDPRLLAYGPVWLKYEVSFTSVDRSGNVLGEVVMHYEYNPATGHYTSPPHFTSTVARGCANGG
jgi:hypothetical protein